MVPVVVLPLASPLAGYQRQADDLLVAHHAADLDAIQLFHHKHPRFLDEKIPWLPKPISDEEIAAVALDIDDARLALARWYDFLDWPSLVAFVESLADPVIFRFESAVDAVVNGDAATLRELLAEDPSLVHARSTRICHFDPPSHQAMLLHYIGANGVEGYRQKTPPNAVEITKILLDAGADPNALTYMYGGATPVMSMLVSSCHPANAGLQSALVEVLAAHGASVEPEGSGNWKSPLWTALIFGYGECAATLVRCGATVDNAATAAGLGRTDDFRRLLPDADADTRQRALILAAMHNQVEPLAILLEAGEDPNRFNPPGAHAHSTPLHQAALAGHAEAVRLMVEHGARLDIQDPIYHGTAAGWAAHGGHEALAQYLRERQ